MSVQPLISVRGLCVVKQGDAILQDITLNIHPREFITILGPNGAGKTTLLRCLIGLRAHTSGSIVKKEGLRIGYVPQLLNLNKMMRMSVRQFLFLAARNRSSVQQLIDEYELAPLLDKQMMHLSGGERQQVLITRALSHQPDLLVLDEPTQHLDISGRTKFYQRLQSIYQQKRVAILLISHDLNLVMRSNHHVICLNHHICCQGKPDSISKDPAFTNLYQMDSVQAGDLLTVYHHHHDHTHD